MAFSFGNLGAAMTGAATNPGAGSQTEGPDLELIQTEGLGFLAVAGDAKVQLVPRWDSFPAPTATLLAIASHKGLVAAAGPGVVHVATTQSVRKAFESPKPDDSEIRPFEPQIKIPMQLRVSQLAFTADDKYLVLSAEQGGGLAVYDVDSLSQGSTQAAFELSTSGETLRALVPNPMADKAELCAIVTNNGNLLMANLKERALVSGPNGQVLKSQVSCAAWSSKGKQLVAGCGDGSIFQMTPEGQEKAHIPKPPKLGDYHVASVAWLENDVFLVIHNPTNGQGQSAYHLITRHAKAGAAPSFVYQKLSDPIEPFGDKRPHHSILRLRDFPPNLQDMLIVASTAVENIGLLTRSKTPLTSSVPAEKITNVFTTTELADDSKRAQVPMAEDFSETFPVGVALDLSSKDKVYKPIPTDEIEESPGPLPGLWVLNNEGVLASWWIVYNESIRQGTTYPGLVAVEGEAASKAGAFSSPKPATAFSSSTTTTPAPAFGGTSALGGSKSPWATTTPTGGSAFGTSAFGSGPAANTPKFGAPSFGTPSLGGAAPLAPAFGQSSMIGMGARASPWASGSTATAAPAFGQSSFGSASTPPSNPFASKGSAAASPFTSISSGSGGGFAGFANKGGFASLAGGTSGSGSGSGGSIFGKPSGTFGSSTPEVSMDTDTAFPPRASKPEGTSSLFGSTPFVLGTTFKADLATANQNEKETPKAGGGSLFGGGGFNLSLGGAGTAPAAAESKDEDMDTTPPSTATPSAAEPSKPKSIFESTTPTTTPAPSKFFSTALNTTPAPGGGLFGLKPSTTTPFGSLFGTPKVTETQSSIKDESNVQTPKVKPEEVEEEEDKENRPGLPLPPDTTSKAVFPFGESSSSSGTSAPSPKSLSMTPSNKNADEPPLPPEPFPKVKKEPEEAPLPPEPSLAKAGEKEKPAAPREVPLPPDPFAKAKSKQAEPEDAPLPPDPFASAIKKPLFPQTPALPPLSAQPALPDNVEEGELSEGELSEEGEASEEEDESEGEEEGAEEGTVEEVGSEAGSEGSGVDVARDLSPTTTTMGFSQTPGFTPQSSFAGMTGSVFSTTSTTRGEERTPRLFGEVSRAAPIFPPPERVTSPRSPSPQRPIKQGAAPAAIQQRMLRAEGLRSVSAPGMASQILGAPRPPGPGLGMSATGGRPVAPIIDINVEERRRAQAKKEAEEMQPLVDEEEYEILDRQLDAPVEPTLQLAECVYRVGGEVQGGASIASQNEAVYRDINQMILSLKFNARNISAFIAGHSGQGRTAPAPKHKEDLESPDDWVLCDIDTCGKIVRGELAQELQEARVKDADALKEACEELLKDLARLGPIREDITRAVQSQIDPEQVAATRSLPLSAEQAAQQNDLRRSFTNFMKRLAEAEQQLVLLRTKVASAASASGKGAGAVPSVDAVLRTITKMTSMVEKRSGDIDVLENQIRKLGLSQGQGQAQGLPGRGSREGSPFATPQKKHASAVFSPGHAHRSSLTSSVMSMSGAAAAAAAARGTPPRRKVSGYTDKEKAAIRERMAGRTRTLEGLRAALRKNGPNFMPMDEE